MSVELYTQGDLDALLMECTQRNVSGLHFAGGLPVTVNEYGRLRALDPQPLTHHDVARIASWLHNPQAVALVGSRQPISARYSIRADEVTYRYRVQMIAIDDASRDSLHITLRMLPGRPPPMTELGIDATLQTHLLSQHEGLVVIAGPTGHGKTTTAASMLTAYAADHPVHIATYEDPIEYPLPRYLPSGAIINQTEIGTMCEDWAGAIRAAVRREPHVLFIGELRDAASLGAVLQLALTGHLCLTTFHAGSVPETVARLTEMFPDSERRQGLRDLMLSLRLLIGQRLVPTPDGRRIAVHEYVPLDGKARHQLAFADNPAEQASQLVAERGCSFLASLLALHQRGDIDYACYQAYAGVLGHG